VQWDAPHEHFAAELKMLGLRHASPSKEERAAADEVLFMLVPLHVAECNADISGTTTVHESNVWPIWSACQCRTSLQRRPANRGGGDLLVPWRTTVAIARTAAAQYPYRIMREV